MGVALGWPPVFLWPSGAGAGIGWSLAAEHTTKKKIEKNSDKANRKEVQVNIESLPVPDFFYTLLQLACCSFSGPFLLEFVG